MTLTDILTSEALVDRMESALENREYHIVGKVIHAFDTYTRLFLSEVEEKSHDFTNENDSVDYILMDLPDTAKNISFFVKEIDYLYSEIRNGLKKIDNPKTTYPKHHEAVLKSYYEPILESVALKAMEEFRTVAKYVEHYTNSQTRETHAPI